MTDRARQSIVEQLLVLRCKAGDAAAFAQLVDRYDRRVRYYLQKMLCRGDGVDDVLQDLWLDVFRSIGKLHEPRAFPAWLYRLARDRAWRDLRRRRLPVASADLGGVVDPSAEVTFSAEDAEAIHRALDALVPERREVLLLRFVEDMSYEQIAAVVGCVPGTVRSRLHYGKRDLKRLLEATAGKERP
jgi:RNA polymerase sigma-70 factor, ECF subfamily